MKSEAFYPSVESIANHFGCHRTTVFKALQECVEMDWAEVIQREPGKAVVYRFLDHEEWARKNPGCCIAKDTMPWEGEGDSLGREMYAVSGGQAKFLPRQMIGLRKSGFSDQQIVSEFRTFLDRNPQTGPDWKRVYYRFHTHLLRLAKDLSKAVGEKNSCSDPSRGSDPYPSRGSDTPHSADATPTRRAHATQVFEYSGPKGHERASRREGLIPTPASQERPHSSAIPSKAFGRGEPPSKPSPKTSAPAARKIQ